LAQLLDLSFLFLSGGCGLFYWFILPAFATEVVFDLNPYNSLNGKKLLMPSYRWLVTTTTPFSVFQILRHVLPSHSGCKVTTFKGALNHL
jgi:hypothetical protein